MTQDIPTVLFYGYGYLYALVLGQIFISNITRALYQDWKIERTREGPLAQVLGSIEIFLFISAIKIGRPEFIPVWLTLKTATGWTHWNQLIYKHQNSDGKEIPIPGRMAFNIFLVGNGLTIAFSLIGAQFITWLERAQHLQAFGAAIGTAAVATWLYSLIRPPKTWLRKQTKSRERTN